MNKFRLVKIDRSDGTTYYEIERRFLLFFWSATEWTDGCYTRAKEYVDRLNEKYKTKRTIL